ncbi:PBP1A family penicillin-binding protein [bacterium]|nr:PBP1A family penicillin-binding protein [bacterium]
MDSEKKPSGASRKRQPSRHPLAWSLRAWLWILVIGAASVAGLCVGTFFGFLSKQDPIPELEHYDPPQVTRVYDRTGREVVARFFDENREVVAQAQMPLRLKQAFLSVEDERFYQHFGVDVQGVIRAMVANIQSGSITQGGSTITQQLARNILPRKIGSERSFERKFREALAAFLIEQRYSKDQILEFYLNHIFLGHNAYGVQSAAKTYFGKDVRDLSLGESACLAAVPKSPTMMNPRTNPEKLKIRRNLILSNMARLGYIEPETADVARKEDLVTTRTLGPRVQFPYFNNDYLRQTLRENAEIGEDLLLRGGYHVYSSQDTAYQRIVQEEVARALPGLEQEWQQRKYHTGWQPHRLRIERREFPKKHGDLVPRPGQTRLAKITSVRPDGVEVEIEGYTGFAPLVKIMAVKPGSKEPVWTGRYKKPWFFPEEVLKEGEYIDVVVREVSKSGQTMVLRLYDETHIQAAAVLLEAKTGRILAMSGGADYYDVQNSGMFNRATATPGRQPGSAFKPLLYATALENGYTLGSVIMDDRTVFGTARMPYLPRNYENEYYGPTTLLRGLSKSNNVVTVKLLHALGFRKALPGYYKFDILDDEPTWNLPSGQLSVCLGSHSATPLSMAAAYLPFTRKGLIIEPIGVTRVADLNGETIQTIKPRERYVISPETAYIATYMLGEVVHRGTGKPVIGDYFDWTKTPAMGGKTGTTTDCVDAWFVGFTPDLVLAVWVGFDQHRPMGPGMTGSRCAAPIWRAIMERVIATRKDWKMDFDVPANIVFRDISSQTGLLIDPQGRHGEEQVLSHVPFVKGTEPTAISPGYQDFPYWKYQNPDPVKNQIENPNEIPPHLLAVWQAERIERGYIPTELEEVWDEDVSMHGGDETADTPAFMPDAAVPPASESEPQPERTPDDLALPF